VLGDPLGLPLGEPDGEPLGEPDGEPLGLVLGEPDALALGEALGDAFELLCPAAGLVLPGTAAALGPPPAGLEAPAGRDPVGDDRVACVALGDGELAGVGPSDDADRSPPTTSSATSPAPVTTAAPTAIAAPRRRRWPLGSTAPVLVADVMRAGTAHSSET
jgi:hypothetical protein